MIRNSLLAALLALAGCAQPPPELHVDGEVVTRAVQHAQAQVDRDRGGDREEHGK